MRELHTRGPKLHWHNLDASQRRKVVSAVADFNACHIVVVGTQLDPRRQERARALCLEKIAWELGTYDITNFVLEARTESLNRRDRQLVDALRGRRALPPGLRIDHELPSQEPMLWIADQVLGAVGESLTGRSQWYEALKPAVTIIDIDV